MIENYSQMLREIGKVAIILLYLSGSLGIQLVGMLTTPLKKEGWGARGGGAAVLKNVHPKLDDSFNYIEPRESTKSSQSIVIHVYA